MCVCKAKMQNKRVDLFSAFNLFLFLILCIFFISFSVYNLLVRKKKINKRNKPNFFFLKIGPKERTGAEDCASARCGMDAGCRHEPDGSWICICTHDLSPQRPDGSCPRFVGQFLSFSFQTNGANTQKERPLLPKERSR